MSETNCTLPLAEATPGTILALDLLDTYGALLLPAGTVLSEALLASLAQRGIEQIVVCDTSPGDETESAARRQRLANRIEYLFRAAGDNIAMRELQSQITSYRLGRPS